MYLDHTMHATRDTIDVMLQRRGRRARDARRYAAMFEQVKA